VVREEVMSDTTLDLMDTPVYEVRQVAGWDLVLQHYAQGWRCAAAFTISGVIYYVLERPVR
jgi:hypothetical protein